MVDIDICLSCLPPSRLFGIVNRIAPEKDKSKLICHVLEAQNGMAVSVCVYMCVSVCQGCAHTGRWWSAQPSLSQFHATI